MRHIKSALLFMVLSQGVLPLFGENPVIVPWNRVCETARGQELIVTTDAGENLQGYCVSITTDEIAVRTKDRGIVRVGKSSLKLLQLYRPPEHPLRSLGKGIQTGLATGIGFMFSPAAPVGIVMVPGTVAWGAVSAPFCLIGELLDRKGRIREVKPQ